MKHLFIINPVAGKGHAVKYTEQIQGLFKDTKEEYEIIVTKGPGDATKVVQAKTEKEPFIVYSIGGDGTLNEVLNGIANTKSVLAVIPSGSGNDFARTIYDNKEFNLKTFESIIKGKDIDIDLGLINDRYFLNISSIGVDAAIAEGAIVFKKNKFISGSLSYLLSLIKTVSTFKALNVTYIIDEKEFNEDLYLVAAANGSFYGGGIKIAPFADIGDGLLDIYVIRKPKFFKLFSYVIKVLKGEDISTLEEVRYLKGKNIKLESKKEIAVNIDGEIIISKEIDFKILPKSIKLRVPNTFR